MQLWAAIDLLGGSVVTLRKGRVEEKKTWTDSALDLATRWEREMTWLL